MFLSIALNLPDIIQFTAGHKNRYTYNAAGQKLEVVNYMVSDIVNVPMDTITALPDPSRYTTSLDFAKPIVVPSTNARSVETPIIAPVDLKIYLNDKSK